MAADSYGPRSPSTTAPAPSLSPYAPASRTANTPAPPPDTRFGGVLQKTNTDSVPQEDEAVLALRKQTESIRALIDAMRQTALASRVQAADAARDKFDQTLRLTSGQGLRREDDDGVTLLARPQLRKPSSAKPTSVRPVVANATVSPASSVTSNPLITSPTVVGGGGSRSVGRITMNLR